MGNIKDQKITILLDKKTVYTQAVFWKIPHNTKDDEIHLKIGRYKRLQKWFGQDPVESAYPKSEL